MRTLPNGSCCRRALVSRWVERSSSVLPAARCIAQLCYARAVTHCECVTDGRATDLLPSLYLNLADSLLAVGRRAEARVVAERAAEHLQALRADGYRSFVALAIARLQERLVDITTEVSPAHE